MIENKYRCSSCGAFEVIYVEKSANPFNSKPARYVCQKCGKEFPLDSKINIMNKGNINTFPNPNKDLDFNKKFKPKIDHNTINPFPNPNKDLEVDNPFPKKLKPKKEVY